MTHTSEPYFTKCNNSMLDYFYLHSISPLKMRIIQFLIRHTYGYHKECICISISGIASKIKVDKAWAGRAIRELVRSNVILIEGKSGISSQTRILKLNADTDTWHLKSMPSEEVSRKKKRVADQSSTGNCRQNRPMGVEEKVHCEVDDSCPIAVDDNCRSARERIIHPAEPAYIDSKDEVFQPKEIFKENKKDRYIYLYDINLIPRTLTYIEDFKEMFNNWCIHREQMGKPLTHKGREVQMRKLLMYNAEGYNVISIIENSITGGWTDFYRPGVKQPIPSRQIEYKSARQIRAESY